MGVSCLLYPEVKIRRYRSKRRLDRPGDGLDVTREKSLFPAGNRTPDNVFHNLVITPTRSLLFQKMKIQDKENCFATIDGCGTVCFTSVKDTELVIWKQCALENIICSTRGLKEHPLGWNKQAV